MAPKCPLPHTLVSPSSKDISNWLLVHFSHLQHHDSMSTQHRGPLVPRSIAHVRWAQSLWLVSGFEWHLPILKFCTLVSPLQLLKFGCGLRMSWGFCAGNLVSRWWFWGSGTFQRLDTVEGDGSVFIRDSASKRIGTVLLVGPSQLLWKGCFKAKPSPSICFFFRSFSLPVSLPHCDEDKGTLTRS